jgi:hypothetical protein
MDFKIAYDSVRGEVLYNILIEFGVPTKLARLSKVCLNETYRRDVVLIIIIQFNSLLFMCRVNSHKANYRHSTVQIYIIT